MTQVTAVLAVAPITTCPPNHTSLIPFLCIDGAAAAIDFYVSVFGAKLVDRMDGPNGIVAHAALDFGNGRLQLSDPQEAYQIAAPDPEAFATHPVALYCPDVDDVVRRPSRPVHHAEEAAGALKFTLAPDESARLAELSRAVTG